MPESYLPRFNPVPYAEDEFRGFFDFPEVELPTLDLSAQDLLDLATVTITLRPAALQDLMLDEAHRLGLSHLVDRLSPTRIGHLLGPFEFARRRDEAGVLYTFTPERLNQLLELYQVPLPTLPNQASLVDARRALAALPNHDERRALLFG